MASRERGQGEGTAARTVDAHGQLERSANRLWPETAGHRLAQRSRVRTSDAVLGEGQIHAAGRADREAQPAECVQGITQR